MSFKPFMVKTVALVSGVLFRLHSRLSRLNLGGVPALLTCTFSAPSMFPMLTQGCAALTLGYDEAAPLGLGARPAGMPAPL